MRALINRPRRDLAKAQNVRDVWKERDGTDPQLPFSVSIKFVVLFTAFLIYYISGFGAYWRAKEGEMYLPAKDHRLLVSALNVCLLYIKESVGSTLKE